MQSSQSTHRWAVKLSFALLLVFAGGEAFAKKTKPASPSAFVRLPSLVANHPCRSQIEFLLREKDSKYDWVQIAMPGPKDRAGAFRSANFKFGSWVEIQVADRLTAIEFEKDKARRIEFDSKTCARAKVSAFEPYSQFQNTKGKLLVFNDLTLEVRMNSDQQVFLYLWSPKMIYSAKLHEQFRSVATKLGYDFISIVDDEVDDQTVNEFIAAHKIKGGVYRLGSNELLLRQAKTHFPESYIISKKKLSLKPIIGVMDDAGLEKAINQAREVLDLSL